MKVFIYLIAVTSILQFLAAHLYMNFKGSSRAYHSYLSLISGFGAFLTYALFVWACFVTTWWIPIAAYAVAWMLKIFIPPFPTIELIASFLFPISALASIVLLVLNI